MAVRRLQRTTLPFGSWLCEGCNEELCRLGQILLTEISRLHYRRLTTVHHWTEWNTMKNNNISSPREVDVASLGTLITRERASGAFTRANLTK